MEENAKLRFIIKGANGENAELLLGSEQAELLEMRFSRAFFIRCGKEKIIAEIERAGSYRELEALARKYYLCDACNFADINIYGAKRALKVIVNVLYEYPKLRSKLCFIGTQYGLEKLLVGLQNGNKEVLNDFNLQYICSEENARNLGNVVMSILKEIIGEHESYVALSMFAFGMLDSILLDKNDYDGYAYIGFVSELRDDEKTGFHPIGCNSPEYVIYHELGHLLSNMCGLEDKEEFKTFYSSLSREEIRKGLSEYAEESPSEFIAEAFAETICNPEPRKIARKVGELLKAAYKEVR